MKNKYNNLEDIKKILLRLGYTVRSNLLTYGTNIRHYELLFKGEPTGNYIESIENEREVFTYFLDLLNKGLINVSS